MFNLCTNNTKEKIYVLRLKKRITFLLANLIISHNNSIVLKNKYIVYMFNKCKYLLIDVNGNLKYIVIYAQCQ